MAKAITKAIRVGGGKRRRAGVESKSAETKLMWMPGVRPVKVPMRTPTTSATRISRIRG